MSLNSDLTGNTAVLIGIPGAYSGKPVSCLSLTAMFGSGLVKAVLLIACCVGKSVARLRLVDQRAENSGQSRAENDVALQQALATTSWKASESTIYTHHLVLPGRITVIESGDEIVFELGVNITVPGTVAAVTQSSTQSFVCSGYTGDGKTDLP
jgi:hypothetical protein